VKYFFLADGWSVGRVWELGGLWNERAWRRPPLIDRINLYIVEHSEKLWLYQVEAAVLMVEVQPTGSESVSGAAQTIGQVILKRLITAEQVIERLCQADTVAHAAPSPPADA
jgi:hypothetical protein